MDNFLPTWLDQFFRQRPAVILAAIIVLAMITWLVIFAGAGTTVVVYEAF